MIWSGRTCRICHLKMEIEYGADYEPIYMLRCLTPPALPEHMARPKFGIKGNTFKSHFEVQWENNEPVYECAKVYPFMIQSYKDVSNLYVFDARLNSRFIAETPYLELPWDDMDRLVTKLKTYTVFS